MNSVMNQKILFLLVLAPIVASQTAEDVTLSILDLYQQVANFEHPKNYNEFKYPITTYAGKYGEYDFIIIGAGSAGTLLANKLSEVSKWSILLLEAGQNETLYTDVPAMAGALQFSEVNWGYQSVPQTNCCLGMNNNQCQVPRGKVLGGSSTINYMMYVRGNADNYDSWARAGNPGWSYKEILPYFKQVENSSLTENVDPDYHGNQGTLHVEHVQDFVGLGQAFLDANLEKGSRILDYNGEHQVMGVSKVQSTTINGRRCSGNKAFLNPVIGRKNLKVVTGAFVTKLNIESNKATSVEFLLGVKKYYATTRHEIILSAGAIGSPQILLHSGIGPKEDLEKLEIKVQKDLPVGKNLHDHAVIPYPLQTNFTHPSFKSDEEMVRDYLNGLGYFTVAGNLEALGFNNYENPNSSLPDSEMIWCPFLDVSDRGVQLLLNFRDDIYDDLMKSMGEGCAFYTQVLLHPKSRGTVKLKSKNVFDHPLIDLNYFSHPDDFKPMINGLKYLNSLTETEALKRFNFSIPYNPLSVCPQKFFSDEYLRCYVQHLTSTIFHQAGTCKMGPDSDPEAVVDARLKVKGFENLRVIDASIMPTPVSGHNNAPTYMIAAKGADMIKEDWHPTTQNSL